MVNKIIKIALLATLPMMAIGADNNLTKDPFANDPMFKHFQKLHKDMNKIFEEFNREFFDKKTPYFKADFSKGLTLSPKTDFIDKGDVYELKVDLPGIEKNEIKVTLKDNLISIDAKSEEKKEEKKDNKVIKRERFVGVMHRSLTLPKDANPKKYKTDYKNGVLTVIIEKKK